MSTPKKPPKSARWSEFNSFVDFTLRALTRSEVAVWLVLFRDTKKNGRAQTGQTDIARRTGLSERQVRYALAGLVKKTLVRVVKKGRINAGASVYQVRVVLPPAKAETDRRL